MLWVFRGCCGCLGGRGMLMVLGMFRGCWDIDGVGGAVAVEAVGGL